MATDSAPFIGRSYHVTNSVLVWGLTARCLLGCERLLLRRGAARAADLFYALMLPALCNQAVSVFFTSPSPDLCVGLFGIILAGELIVFLELAPGDESHFLLRAIAWIGAAAITVKLSIGGLAIAIVPVAFLCWWWRERQGLPAAGSMLVQLALIVAFGVVPWIGSNLITSGCPLYPSKWGALPVDWTTKLDAVGWIQRPMMLDVRELFRDPTWFRGALISLGWSDSAVLDSLAVGIFALVVGVPLRLWRWWRGKSAGLSPVILVPTLVSFVFCFLNAPMPRYQGTTIWVLPVQLVLLGMGETIRGGRWWLRAGAVAFVVWATAMPFWRGKEVWSEVKQFEIVGRTPVEEVRLASGLVVTVPKGTPTCLDASLPCTPEPHPGLRLRRADDLASGFTIDLSVADETPPTGR
ncbi:MAG: hypothetical protein HY270_09720 [Deltaproteobacteria bacterium]|nr:hypothetical protein [Deltaproteobacteria bacterium]